MEQIITQPETFGSLSHGTMGYCDATFLDDFSFNNQRGERSKVAFDDLCGSVKKHKGVHTAIGVRFNPNTPEKLEIIFGHGRRDAAIKTKHTLVPFKFFAVDDATAFELHLSENLDRSDLDTVAKAKAAQSYLAHFKADYEAVASKLNMSVKKLRELLELNKCSEKVLQAVKDKKISEGHAILLAPFHKTKQDKNLNLIIAEGWTIATLKERTGKVKLPLSRAVFDTKACDGCEFNSAHQIGLFEIGDAKAECTDSVCYKKKTTSHLDESKKELSEKYGHILLLSECSKDDRNAVNADKLGNSQWAICRSCDDKVAVLNDDIYKNLGAVLPDQCVNKVCFTKCKKSYDDEVKSLLETQISDSENATESEKNNAKAIAKKTTKAKAKGTLPNKAIENYKSILRQSSATFYADDARFNECVLTASVVSQSGYKIKEISSSRFSDVIVFCLSLTKEQRMDITKKAIHCLLNKSETDANNATVTSTLINCMKEDNATSIDHVTSHWTPSKENLEVFTADLLPPLLKSAKFNITIGDDEFNKLCKKGKKDIIQAVLKTEHDWSKYAPKSLLKMISK